MLHTRPETFSRKHSLVAHRRQNSLSIQSTLSDRFGSVGQKLPSRVGSRVKGSFRPGSISVSGSAESSPAGFGAEPRPPKGFPLFSALWLMARRMASPDTIILLIVDYHTAIGEPHAPLGYAPGTKITKVPPVTPLTRNAANT